MYRKIKSLCAIFVLIIFNNPAVASVEYGLASWYGGKNHMKLTASGQKFNKNDLTAAHKKYKMFSVVKVTNLKNGKCALLTINDRGPFKYQRKIDVSEFAAEYLGFKKYGLAKVKIEPIDKLTDLNNLDRCAGGLPWRNSKRS